jgi:hypothetical protein
LEIKITETLGCLWDALDIQILNLSF